MAFIFEEYVNDVETEVTNFRAKAEEKLADAAEAVEVFSDVVTYLDESQEKMKTLYRTLKTAPLNIFHEAQQDFTDWCGGLADSWDTLVGKSASATGSEAAVYGEAMSRVRNKLLGTSILKDIGRTFSDAKAACGAVGDVKDTVKTLIEDASSLSDMCNSIKNLDHSYNSAVSAVSAASFSLITQGRSIFARVEYVIESATQLEAATADEVGALVTGVFTTNKDLSDQAKELYGMVTGYFGDELLAKAALYQDQIGDALYTLTHTFDLSSLENFTASLSLIVDTDIVEIAESVVETVTTAGSKVVATVNGVDTALSTISSVFSDGRSDGAMVLDEVVADTEGVFDSLKDIAVKSCGAANIALNQVADLMVAQNRITSIISETRDGIYSAATEEYASWKDAYTSIRSELQQGAEYGS